MPIRRLDPLTIDRIAWAALRGKNKTVDVYCENTENVLPVISSIGRASQAADGGQEGWAQAFCTQPETRIEEGRNFFTLFSLITH
jgi:hypothetical protein